MKKFILASSNLHKAQEFQELFHGSLSVDPAPSAIPVEETGTTFTENALLKAQAYAASFKASAMADDSGLVLEGFPNLLGVQSARFAPELSDYILKCQKLLEILKGAPNRRAYFVCVLCFYFSEKEVYFFEGRVNGVIGEAIRGNQGFGYDPIFIPDRNEDDGKSLAELPQWKQTFSHRAKAAHSALQFFKESMDKISK